MEEGHADALAKMSAQHGVRHRDVLQGRDDAVAHAVTADETIRSLRHSLETLQRDHDDDTREKWTLIEERDARIAELLKSVAK